MTDKNFRSGIVAITKPTDFYKCGNCGKEYDTKTNAEICQKRGKMIAHLKATIEEGKFLLVGKEVIPVGRLEEIPDKTCRGTVFNILSACSNDTYELNGRNWFDARSITIAEVVDLGWRVWYKDVWMARASEQMKEEYINAIKKIIYEEPEVQLALAIEHLAFCRK